MIDLRTTKPARRRACMYGITLHFEDASGASVRVSTSSDGPGMGWRGYTSATGAPVPFATVRVLLRLARRKWGKQWDAYGKN
jgi:hypothetical protein